MMTPLTPKIAVEISMTRMSTTVRCWIAGASAGAMTVRTIHGASIIASRLTGTITTSSRLITADASRHAPTWSSCVSRVVKTGIKAEPSAPPAMTRKSISGIRSAAT